MHDHPKPPQFALVAYVRGPLGEWVEALRAEVDPEQAHLAAHVTVLPPRTLAGTEAAAIAELRVAAAHFLPFEVEFGEPDSFLPGTPTVFVAVTNSAQRLREMHNAFNTGTLAFDEPWPYVPHLTVAKMPDEAAANQVLALALQRYESYSAAKNLIVNELVFVREAEDGRWIDLAKIALKHGATRG